MSVPANLLRRPAEESGCGKVCLAGASALIIIAAAIRLGTLADNTIGVIDNVVYLAIEFKDNRPPRPENCSRRHRSDPSPSLFSTSAVIPGILPEFSLITTTSLTNKCGGVPGRNSLLSFTDSAIYPVNIIFTADFSVIISRPASAPIGSRRERRSQDHGFQQQPD